MKNFKEIFKENYALSLTFVLIVISLVVWVFTREPNILAFSGTLGTGFFALARQYQKPQQQTLNADSVENVDLTQSGEKENQGG